MFLRTVAKALTTVSAGLPLGSAAAKKTTELAAKMMAKSNQIKETQTLIASGPAGREFLERSNQFDKAAELTNKTYLDLQWAQKPKRDWRGAYINDLREKDAFEAAVKARDALSKENDALMTAVYQAREASKFKYVTDNQKRELILAELKKANRLTPAQSAAVGAYLAVEGCNGLETMNETISAETKKSRTAR